MDAFRLNLSTCDSVPTRRRGHDSLSSTSTSLSVLKLLGKPVRVRYARVPGTSLVQEGKIEAMYGSYRGLSHEDWGLKLNDAFLRMKDRDQAVTTAAVVFGHELYHLRQHAKVERTMPEFKGAFNYDAVNERGARLKGWLIAYQLSPKKPTSDTRTVRGFVKDPDGYPIELNEPLSKSG